MRQPEMKVIIVFTSDTGVRGADRLQAGDSQDLQSSGFRKVC